MTSQIDSRFSWIRLGANLALSTLGGVGMWSVVVVLPALQAEFGLDRAGATLPFTATMACIAIGGLFMGRLVDRVGVALPVLGGTICLSAGYVLAGFATSVTQFTIIQAVLIALLGASTTFGPLVADTSLWFNRNRGIAVAVCASGNYLAGTIWPPILQFLIERQGWRTTHMIIGAVTILTMPPLILLLRRPAPRDVAAATSRQTHRFGVAGLPPNLVQGMLILAGLACCIAMSMPQVHIVAYCADLGYGPAQGAGMLSLMFGFGIVSRLGSGCVADRIGGFPTLLLGTVLQACALLLYLGFDSLGSLYVISALFGLFQGGIVPSYALVVRELYPANEAVTRVSAVLMATVGGMAIGGWMTGAIFDLTGSYSAAFLNGIAWNALNIGIVVLLMQRRARRLAVA